MNFSFLLYLQVSRKPEYMLYRYVGRIKKQWGQVDYCLERCCRSKLRQVSARSSHFTLKPRDQVGSVFMAETT